MLYYSTNKRSSAVSLREAVIRGLAPDGGLYMPETLPEIPVSYFDTIHRLSLGEIAFDIADAFLGGDIPRDVLAGIIDDALDFTIPLTEVEKDIYSLELFHGPTMAFKDVGARFMSRLMAWLYRNEKKELNVIVATSGDTGSAVAAGFYSVEGINVFVLFPEGKVSPLQQKQITTWGNNIHAVRVKGNFDDCQKLAKQMLSDRELNALLPVTSANSINIARLIPQSFYYFHAYAGLARKKRPVVFSVPSGNFGNLTGGLMARAAGLPVHKFIAATNINDVFPKFMETGKYRPAPSKQTISNAMDVGDPGNFARVTDLLGKNPDKLRKIILSGSWSDAKTARAIKDLYKNTGYIMDPHGAVAYLGLKEYLNKYDDTVSAVFLETAHPAKFPETMKKIIRDYEDLPPQLRGVMNREEKFHSMMNDPMELKRYIEEVNN